jgi:hypothetical protein
MAKSLRLGCGFGLFLNKRCLWSAIQNTHEMMRLRGIIKELGGCRIHGKDDKRLIKSGEAQIQIRMTQLMFRRLTKSK